MAQETTREQLKAMLTISFVNLSTLRSTGSNGLAKNTDCQEPTHGDSQHQQVCPRQLGADGQERKPLEKAYLALYPTGKGIPGPGFHLASGKRLDYRLAPSSTCIKTGTCKRRQEAPAPFQKEEKKGNISPEGNQRWQGSLGPAQHTGPCFIVTATGLLETQAHSRARGRHHQPVWPASGATTPKGLPDPPFHQKQAPSLGASIQADPSTNLSSALRQSKLCFLPPEDDGANGPETLCLFFLRPYAWM
ncbi:uncharacterized protein LOC116559490 [Sapajus apella]|uniref:Uncharacterized protein LOC116559490 n=1 Tax=Sapajus apella TaxID=9515 RepID=A0A6J3IW21_SAPAP|nr:uncharacterized protein LOC116559490 [Sapajus apella]